MTIEKQNYMKTALLAVVALMGGGGTGYVTSSVTIAKIETIQQAHTIKITALELAQDENLNLIKDQHGILKGISFAVCRIEAKLNDEPSSGCNDIIWATN